MLRIVNVTFGSRGSDESVRECKLKRGHGYPARRCENSALGAEVAQRRSAGSGKCFSALATLTTVKDWKKRSCKCRGVLFVSGLYPMPESLVGRSSNLRESAYMNWKFKSWKVPYMKSKIVSVGVPATDDFLLMSD